jgi:NADH pyrophosphatase NudC (nudix superfamily)
MSNFSCCRCKSIGVEVHHILLESEGGSSDIDNAAPLCPNCHTWFGDNPQLRKSIREMRNKHYEDCKRQIFDKEILERVSDSMFNIQKTQQEILENQDKKLEKIAFYVDYISKAITDRFDEIRVKASEGVYPDWNSFSNEIVRASGTASTLFETLSRKRICPKCGEDIESEIKGFGTNEISCPNCGSLVFLSEYKI